LSTLTDDVKYRFISDRIPASTFQFPFKVYKDNRCKSGFFKRFVKLDVPKSPDYIYNNTYCPTSLPKIGTFTQLPWPFQFSSWAANLKISNPKRTSIWKFETTRKENYNRIRYFLKYFYYFLRVPGHQIQIQKFHLLVVV